MKNKLSKKLYNTLQNYACNTQDYQSNLNTATWIVMHVRQFLQKEMP